MQNSEENSDTKNFGGSKKTSCPKGKPRRLTVRQRKYVNEYLKTNGNGTAAAMKAYKIGGKHGTNNPAIVAANISSENLNKPYVKAAIEGRLALKDLSADYVLEKLLEDVEAGERDAIRTKSLELLGKFYRLWQETGNTTVNVLNQIQGIAWGEIDAPEAVQALTEAKESDDETDRD